MLTLPFAVFDAFSLEGHDGGRIRNLLVLLSDLVIEFAHRLDLG